MQELFSTPYKRRIFITIASLVILVLFLLRYFVIPRFCTTQFQTCVITDDIINNLISSSMAGLGITVLIFLLTPRDVRRAGLRVIEPRDIRFFLEDSRSGSNRYWFDGNSGRYTRGVTLPYFAGTARSENTTKEVSILVLDPDDEGLCARYAQYRASLRSASSNQEWTADRVRNESYATIAASYCWRHEQTRLDVRVFLRNHFSLFRSDVSTKAAVITKEDPQEPGLYCEAGTFFYDAFLEDLRLEMQQARELPRGINAVSLAKLDTPSLGQLLSALGIKSQLTPDDAAQVVELAKNLKNPYA